MGLTISSRTLGSAIFPPSYHASWESVAVFGIVFTSTSNRWNCDRLRRLRERSTISLGDREDAATNVCRRPAWRLRPAARFLDPAHRHNVLRAISPDAAKTCSGGAGEAYRSYSLTKKILLSDYYFVSQPVWSGIVASPP